MSSTILKDIWTGKSAKSRIISGVELGEQVVGDTIGYRGRTTLIETDGTMPFPTKDGKNSIENMFLTDPVENLGLELLKEAVNKTVNECGDGTTTTVVLANAFTKYAHEDLEKGASAVDIKISLEKSKEKIKERPDCLKF